MLDPVAMWIVGAVIVLLPFVIMIALNARALSDSKGRRLSRRWTGRDLVRRR